MTSKSQYRSVESDEKFEDVPVYQKRSSSPDSLGSTLLEEEHERDFQEPRPRWSARWIWLAHAVLLTLSFSMFVSTFFLRGSTLKMVQQYSAWSPAADAVEYVKVKFNNTMGEGSPYVGAGPEVDKAWNALSYDIGDQIIPIEALGKIDMPADSLRYIDPKTGAESVRVGLEVFHQLHCVNLLRQVTYKDYYQDKSGEFLDGAEALQIHTDHCLEILRMNLQCNADVGVFTFYMLEDDPLPWPELNSWHTCRNFNRVRDWALDNSVGNMERPDIHQV